MKHTNNVARWAWAFSALFLLMCAAFTYVLIRDGAAGIPIDPPRIPDAYPPWVLPAVLLAFWAVGVGLAKHLTGIPCVEVQVDALGSVRIRRRYPFRSETQTVLPEDLTAVEIVESKDSDGDPYFSVRLTTAGGRSVDMAESSDRRACESVLADVRRALAGLAPG